MGMCRAKDHPESWHRHRSKTIDATLDVIASLGGDSQMTNKRSRYAENTSPLAEHKELSTPEKMFGDFAPAPVRFTDEVLFGQVWLRQGLAPKERSLVTVARLVTSRAPEQLVYHLGPAEETGASEQELIEAITHLAFYAGWPKAMAAMSLPSGSCAAPSATRATAWCPAWRVMHVRNKEKHHARSCDVRAARRALRGAQRPDDRTPGAAVLYCADPGTRKLDRLEENIGAAGVELTPDDLQESKSAMAQLSVQGARHPEKRERLTGR
jgi:4-carboxymuconolactone decarboxylase